MTELQVINRILESKDLSILTSNYIDKTYFEKYIDEIEYILRHKEEYGNIPDKETFISKFNDFEFIDVTESNRYLVDTLCEEYNFRLTLDTINKCADLMQSDSWDAVDYLRHQLPTLTRKNNNIGVDIIAQANDRLEEWEKLKNNPNEAKLETGFKELDEVIGGLSKGEELAVIFARTGMGKEQPLSSNILTPNGWVKMGDIKKGDIIYSGTSELCNVIGVFPQGIKDVYKLTFSDGSFAECGLEHLWKVQKGDDRKNNVFRVLTLKDILKDIPYRTHKNYSIPFISPIQYPKKHYKISPYLLGVLIGDGCFVVQGGINVSLSDIELQEIVSKELRKIGYKLSKIKDSNVDFRIIKDTAKKPFYTLIDELGLNNHKSTEKFIPMDYLYGCIDDRISLLRGLMDTDGYASCKKASEQFFNTSSSRLSQDMLELVRGLGCYAKISERDTSYFSKKYNKRVNCSKGYEIRIKSVFNVFKIKSKGDKWKYCDQQFNKYIKSIDKVRQEECQCIMVDHKDHTYITDGHTITHNTFILIKMLQHLWKIGARVGLLEPEMTANKIGYRFDTMNANISNSDLTRGNNVDNYVDYVDNLKKSKNPLFVIHPRDFKKKVTISKLRTFIQANNLDVLAIDGITYLTDERMQRGDNRTTSLTNISEDLMDLSIELKIPIIVVAQSNREGAKQDDLTLESIRDSDGIAYNSTIVLAIQQKENDELQLKVIKNRNGKNNVKISYTWDIDRGIFSNIGTESGNGRRNKNQDEEF